MGNLYKAKPSFEAAAKAVLASEEGSPELRIWLAGQIRDFVAHGEFKYSARPQTGYQRGNSICISKDYLGYEDIVAHEVAHWAAYKVSVDCSQFAETFKKEANSRIVWGLEAEFLAKISEKYSPLAISMISDAVGSCRQVPVIDWDYTGHELGYFQTGEELFAEYISFAIFFPEILQVFREEFPKTFFHLKKVVGKLL